MRKRRRLTQRRLAGSVAASVEGVVGGGVAAGGGCGAGAAPRGTTLQTLDPIASLPARSTTVTLNVRSPGAAVSSAAPELASPTHEATPEPASEHV